MSFKLPMMIQSKSEKGKFTWKWQDNGEFTGQCLFAHDMLMKAFSPLLNVFVEKSSQEGVLVSVSMEDANEDLPIDDVGRAQSLESFSTGRLYMKLVQCLHT